MRVVQRLRRRRFGSPLRQAVLAGSAEARSRGDARVGTEHLVLGLLHPPSPAAAALHDLGIDLVAARATLRRLDDEALAAFGIDLGGIDPPAVWRRGHLALTHGAKTALTRAAGLAAQTPGRRLEPEHLLLAVATAAAPDPGADLLRHLGVDCGRLRDRLGLGLADAS